VPPTLEQIPREVRSFIVGQLGLLWDFSEHYVWESRTREQHLVLIRQHTGWRSPSKQDKEELEHWLRTEAAFTACTTDRLFAEACQRLRALGGVLNLLILRKPPVIVPEGNQRARSQYLGRGESDGRRSDSMSALSQ